MHINEARTVVEPIFPDVTDNELNAAIATIDEAALHADEDPKWTTEIWDRTSPINGTPAADILAKRTDIPETGDVVLVLFEDKVIQFQPHDPDQEGLASILDGVQCGIDMKEKSVAERVTSESHAKVIKHVTDQRQPA
jgi:hypothetical protein